LRRVQRNGEKQELPGVAREVGDEPEGQTVLSDRVILVARSNQLPQDPKPGPDRDGHDPGDQPIAD
jgi:hypothetical protein